MMIIMMKQSAFARLIARENVSPGAVDITGLHWCHYTIDHMHSIHSD